MIAPLDIPRVETRIVSGTAAAQERVNSFLRRLGREPVSDRRGPATQEKVRPATCPDCGGEGVVTVNPTGLVGDHQAETCPTCQGSGRAR